jgi:hypothetical protein
MAAAEPVSRAEAHKHTVAMPAEEVCPYCAAECAFRRCATVFHHGYGAALPSVAPLEACRSLRFVSESLRGVACEGLATALAVLDVASPSSSCRWSQFGEVTGQRYRYFCMIAAGRALAREQRAVLPSWLNSADPFLMPLISDGYGFEAMLSKYAVGRGRINQSLPERLQQTRSAFDRGAGRALCLSMHGDPQRISLSIASFALDRQSDVWTGVGTAITYLALDEPGKISALLSCAENNRAAVAHGIAYGASLRRVIGRTHALETACQIAWSRSTDDIAALANETLRNVGSVREDLRFEEWQREIRAAAWRAV